MSRAGAVILAVLAATLTAVGPAVAQTPAAAPAPKVSITGLIDWVTTYYKNQTGLDITDGGKDGGWYSRNRGLLTVTGEVGRAKGVLSLEMDFILGKVGGAAPLGPAGGVSLDLEGDEKGSVEAKWLYLEAPITGPGSLMPFIPVATLGRFGGQPARGHDYKPGIQFSGDFPGVHLETTWSPSVRSRLTFAQIDEALDPVTNPGGTEDYAFIASLEVDVVKGVTVKPTYSYARFDGGAGGTANFGTFAHGGFNPNSLTNKAQVRHTFGGDVRWSSGPWSFQPTFLYQWGTQETNPTASDGNTGVDIRAWIFDATAGYRSGPWTVEGRVMWTSGMKATECVQATGPCAGGSDVKYYQAINAGTLLYFAGWSEIESAGIDYELPLHDGTPNPATLGGNQSYDKYGRIIVAGAVDYALTPALILRLITNSQWTDEKVDTEGVYAGSGITPVNGGDARYLGTEVMAGFTYRFAPNVAFDVIGAVLFAGPARDTGRSVSTAANPQTFSADDVYKAVARLRVTW